MSKNPYSGVSVAIATSTHRPACQVFRLGEPLPNEMPELNISYKNVFDTTLVTIQDNDAPPTVFLSKKPIAVEFAKDKQALVTYMDIEVFGELLRVAIVTRHCNDKKLPEVAERVICLDSHEQPAKMPYKSKLCQALRMAKAHHTIGWQRCAGILNPGTLDLAKPNSHRHDQNDKWFLYHLFFGLIGVDAKRFSMSLAIDRNTKSATPTFGDTAAAIKLWETKQYDDHTLEGIAKLAQIANKMIGNKTTFDEPPRASAGSLEERSIIEHLCSHGVLIKKRRKIRNSLAYKNVYQLTEFGLLMREILGKAG